MCSFADCHFTENLCAESSFAKFSHAGCHYAKKCCYAECSCAGCHIAEYGFFFGGGAIMLRHL